MEMPIADETSEPPLQPINTAFAAMPNITDAPGAGQSFSGAVETWRKTWILRYAPVDVEDPHGGRVTLAGGSVLEQLHEGQRVRVRGFLVPAADRATPPSFHVESLEIVD
jgi:hypothetical protein